MPHFVSDHEIERIGLGVLHRSLPKPEWTHAAHFAAAFWVLKHPQLDAIRDMPGLIRAYNEATGVANTDSGGYHETITLASIAVAKHWLAARSHESLVTTLNELLASRYGRSEWMLEHWSKVRLFSVAARRGWLEPDVAPLPFACEIGTKGI